jgi:putative ABC transport system substrate-binding protein
MFFPVQSVMFVRSRIAAWSVRNRLPTISGWGEFAASGNLLSYGPNLLDCYGRLAHHAALVLRGARPADIPAELPTRVELVVNLRTAREIGVAVPRSILLRADRVIE